MIFPFQNTLEKLWNEGRGDFVGGVLTWLVIGIVGIIAFLFRKAILLGLKKIFNLEPAKPVVEAPPPIQPVPQEVVLRLAGLSSAQLPQLETTSPAPIPRSAIPRPPLAGFVARRDESGRDIIERLKEELLPEKEQLIVLWGAGGVGKTTLAAETARAMRDIFTGGIVWTTADGKPDFGFSTLLDAIATQLGEPDLRQLAPEPKEEAVYHLLSTAPATMIVLDNFETISPAEQAKCAQWLASRASCPALITSRDQVVHARPVRILAMSLPEAREFLQRLTSELGNPQSFQNLDPEKIIQAADRIPRVLQWVVRQIASARQPQTVLDELIHGEGDAAERVFDRSFDLPQLGDDGRATLLSLSLFVPDASRLALSEVAGFRSDLTRLDRAVQQLVELSLVQATAGNERLRIEGLTRELAKARLRKQETATQFTERFVAYFLRYARDRADANVDDFQALEAERENLLRAVDLAFEIQDWRSVGDFAYAIALPGNGWLSVQGFWAEAVKLNQQALEAARRSNSRVRVANFTHNLSAMHFQRGEMEEARALCDESLEIAKESGDQHAIGKRLYQLAMLVQGTKDLAEAKRLYNESMAIMKEEGDEESISFILHQLASLAREEGELAKAKDLYNESLEIKKKLDNRRAITNTLYELGVLAHLQDNPEEARRLYEASLDVSRPLGYQRGIAYAVCRLGELAKSEGKLTEAATLFGEALDIFEKLKLPEADLVKQNLKAVVSAIRDGKAR